MAMIDAPSVNAPQYYIDDTTGVECCDVIETLPFYIASAIKYVWRADKKGNAAQDYAKALTCFKRSDDSLIKGLYSKGGMDAVLKVRDGHTGDLGLRSACLFALMQHVIQPTGARRQECFALIYDLLESSA